MEINDPDGSSSSYLTRFLPFSPDASFSKPNRYASTFMAQLELKALHMGEIIGMVSA